MTPTPRTVVVAGDAILDKTTRVTVRGPSPEDLACTVVRLEAENFSLGGAANVAAGVAALGGRAELVCHVGWPSSPWRQAGLAREFDTLLHDAGLGHRTSLLPVAAGHVPVKERIVVNNRQILRVDTEEASCSASDKYWEQGGYPDLPLRMRNAWLYAPSVFALVDYGKGFFTPAACRYFLRQFETVHESVKFPVLVDPGPGPWRRFSSPRTVFKANLDQARRYCATVAPGVPVPALPARPDLAFVKDLVERVVINMQEDRVAFRALVLTLGAAGLALWYDGQVDYGFQDPVELADPCGAGDTVMAVLAASLAEEPTDSTTRTALWTACGRAARAAAYGVSRAGVCVVKKEQFVW